jgi:hypothetical protein
MFGRHVITVVRVCILMSSTIAVLLIKQSAHTLHALLLLLCICFIRCAMQVAEAEAIIANVVADREAVDAE